MTDELSTILEAIRLSRRELDAYLERPSLFEGEVALARLVSILKHATVSRALDTLSGETKSPPLMPDEGEQETARN